MSPVPDSILPHALRLALLVCGWTLDAVSLPMDECALLAPAVSSPHEIQGPTLGPIFELPGPVSNDRQPSGFNRIARWPEFGFGIAKETVTLAGASQSSELLTTCVPSQVPLRIPVTCCPKTSCGHELWMINTRSAAPDGCLTNATHQLRFYHYVGGRWRTSSREEFLATDDASVSTCFTIHGNDMTEENAARLGWQAYRNLAAHAGCGQRLRLVIWSWPADRMFASLRRDTRLKAPRSDAQGYYMAWLIDQIDPGVTVSMIGYSQGARAIGTALHLLGGGQFAGRQLVDRVHPVRVPMRAVLMAAAIDNNWFHPGCPHDRALSQVDQVLNLYNPRDHALRFYPFLSRPRLPDALGFRGLASPSRLGPDLSKYRALSVVPWVGRRHDWRYYLGSPNLVGAMAPLVFCKPMVEAQEISDPAPGPEARPGQK